MWKKIIWFLLIFIILLLGIFIIGNNYKMTEKKVSILTTGGELSGVMTFPKNRDIKGVILFVHGDGPQTATQDGGYYPLMERFANQGYVSISWDKLGVGNSTGNWLDQSMEERSNEVSEVIDWLSVEHSNVTKSIGLWGASQAGWVIPKVMNNPINNIDFSLIAAPAINWLKQGEYDTASQAKKARNSIEEARSNFRKDTELIRKYDTFTSYKKNSGLSEMTEDRYQFVKRNMNEDITEELTKISKPIALILAENDKNVDSKETASVYEAKINSKNLKVMTVKGVEHQMINPKIAQSKYLINFVGLMLPKYLLIDKEYLDYCEMYVSGI